MEEQQSWHAMTTADVMHALETSPQGLRAEEIKKRQHLQGAVRSNEAVTPIVKIAFRQILSPLTLILFFAMALSVIYGEALEAWLTGAVIAVNAGLGFFQEYKADRALAALRSFLPLQAKVFRDGSLRVIDAHEVVTGDILEVAAGDKVIADGRVFQSVQLATSEAALTGESAEVEKMTQGMGVETAVHDRSNMIYAGTTVAAGRGRVIVTAVGRQTEFGRISALVTQTKTEETPLEKDMKRFARQLAGIMIIVAGGLFLFGLYRGMSIPDMAAVSAAIAVAAVPEGLLVSMTVILAVGTRRMVKRQALVRKLMAAETLGSINVMCIDKTGTITTGDMRVVEVRSGVRLIDSKHFGEREADVRLALQVFGGLGIDEPLASNPTSRALQIYVKDVFGTEIDDWATIDERPFNSKQKYAVKRVTAGKEQKTLVFGAPDILLEMSALKDAERAMYTKVLTDMTARGLRVLLLAHADDDRTLQVQNIRPIGLLGLQDPVRPHVKQVIQKAKSAGIRTVMITGDHPQTALLIAQEVGIAHDAHQIMTGAQLQSLADENIIEKLQSIRVFARVLPEDKLRIVRLLQNQGAVIAMTGDGVNDGPALKAADVGVAMGSGTDVAKETASLVLLDDNVRSIVDAVHEGRIIFENLRKVLVYLLTFSMSETAILAAALALGLPLPFSPLHILWINVVTDGFPGIALAFEKGEQGLMGQKPRGKMTPLMERRMWIFVMLCGLIAMTGLIGTYAYSMYAGASLETARTLLFVSLGIDSLCAVFIMRSLHSGFWSTSLTSNGYLLLAVVIGFGLLLLPVTVPVLREGFAFAPMSAAGWGFVFGLSGVKFAAFELVKYLTVRRNFSQNASVVMMSP